MGKQWKQWQTFFPWAPKSLQMTVAMKLKDAPWKKSYGKLRQHIWESRTVLWVSVRSRSVLVLLKNSSDATVYCRTSRKERRNGQVQWMSRWSHWRNKSCSWNICSVCGTGYTKTNEGHRHPSFLPVGRFQLIVNNMLPGGNKRQFNSLWKLGLDLTLCLYSQVPGALKLLVNPFMCKLLIPPTFEWACSPITICSWSHGTLDGIWRQSAPAFGCDYSVGIIVHPG